MRTNDRPLLLVEDNRDDEELTLFALRGAGVRNDIHVARDGAEALEYLFGNEPEQSEKALPCVVLIDLMLPKIDGFGVLRRIREADSTRLLPVVILTSSDHEDDIARSYELSVNSYVRKPTHFGDFERAVKQLGLYWALLNQPIA